MRYQRQYNFKVRDSVFTTGTHVMAILNVTPDSFWSGSRHAHDAVETARKFIEQGAEIIDIGGQSTRPGNVQVSAIEEMARVLPAVEGIREVFPDIPISVDTFYPDVAQAAIDAGADMINDVSCLQYDGMINVLADTGASVCVMHNRRNTNIKDLFLDKQIGLQNAIDKLICQGVDKDKILLDGGIGFNKNNDEDWQLLKGTTSCWTILTSIRSCLARQENPCSAATSILACPPLWIPPRLRSSRAYCLCAYTT